MPPAVTFSEATYVKPLTSHRYSALFTYDWCSDDGIHASDPLILSTLLRTARTHSLTTLSSQNQPHPITLHTTTLTQPTLGPALFNVTDTKFGRQTSTLQISILQAEGNSREPKEKVVAYVTLSNLDAETGLSFDIDSALRPKPPAWGGNTWREEHRGVGERGKAIHRLRLFEPIDQSAGNVADRRVRLEEASLERFTDDAVGLVAAAAPLPGFDSPGLGVQMVTANLDVKKALPPEGARWLFTRSEVRSVRNGRCDLEVVVLDEDTELVAVASFVLMGLDKAGGERPRL